MRAAQMFLGIPHSVHTVGHTRLRKDDPLGVGEEAEEASGLFQRWQQAIPGAGYHQRVQPVPNPTAVESMTM